MHVCVCTCRYGAYSSGPKSTPLGVILQTVRPVASAPSYTPSSASFTNAGSYNSAQEKVIANYIAQKTGSVTGLGKFAGKKPYNASNTTVYFCDICKISCASSMVSR